MLDNVIANDISHAKAELIHTHDSRPCFDYSTLQQKYLELSCCFFFHPAPELISLIWEIVLTEKWPCHDKTRKLRLKPLGRLTSAKWGYQQIVAIYAKYVMSGINYYNRDVLHSSTLRGYATAVNTFFHLGNLKEPTDLPNTNNMASSIINNLIKEENIASQCKPLENAIFAKIQRAVRSSHSINFNRSILCDVLTLASFIGPRVSENALTTQDKVDYHTYPSGTQVIKVFTAHNFIFHNKNGNVLAQINEAPFDSAVSVEITWHIQRN
jgi:hypothetical protein